MLSQVLNLKKLNALEEEIGYKFKNLELLQNALNHASVLKKSKNSSLTSYEKLEFLGDKVLNVVIAELIFKLFPNDNEGALSIKLNNLVSGKVITEIANEINLMKYVNMSFAAKKNILSCSKNILEDCLEAIFGAIYLDGGFLSAQKSVIFLWKDKIHKTGSKISKDEKTKLQELLQQNGFELPKYVILKNEGSDHEPIFHVEIIFGNESFPKFISEGRALKIAEALAAKKAFDYLQDYLKKK